VAVLSDFIENTLKRKQVPMVFYGEKYLADCFLYKSMEMISQFSFKSLKNNLILHFRAIHSTTIFRMSFSTGQYAEEQQFEKTFMLFSAFAVVSRVLAFWG